MKKRIEENHKKYIVEQQTQINDTRTGFWQDR